MKIPKYMHCFRSKRIKCLNNEGTNTVFNMHLKKGIYFCCVGMSRATWDITIPDDGLQENNEKFRVLLDEPVNAVLGRRVKTNVKIINAENG